MNKLLTALLASAIFLVPLGESMAEPNSITINPGYTKLSHHNGYALINSGKVVLIDVREKEEFESGYIAPAINLPLGKISKETMKEIAPDVAKPVIVYCRSGRRSKEAADKLVGMGYYYVLDLGGITTWPYEVSYPEKQ
ncbi:MAG: rhodanese-like domain-containing protein [Succinivibrio sp.]